MQMIEKESAIFELDEQDLKKVNDKMNYTTKQIAEAIEYWQSYLDESNDSQMVFERKMSRQELDDFYKKLQDDIVEFKYTKKDGTKRNAQGTLKKELMPSEQDLRKQYPDYDDMMKMFKARKDYMIYYWDLEKNAFRQFHVSRFDGFIDDDNVNEDGQDLNGNFYCLDDILEALKGCPSKYEYSQIHIGPYGNHIGDIESIDHEFGTVYLNVKKAHTSMRRGPVEGCMKAVDVIKKFLEIKSQNKGRKVAVYAGEQLDPLSKKLGKKPQLSMIKDVEIAKIDGIWFRI